MWGCKLGYTVKGILLSVSLSLAINNNTSPYSFTEGLLFHFLFFLPQFLHILNLALFCLWECFRMILKEKQWYSSCFLLGYLHLFLILTLVRPNFLPPQSFFIGSHSGSHILGIESKHGASDQ